MARILMIDEAVRSEINTLIERARAKPVRWAEVKEGAMADPGPMLALADRKPGIERPPSGHVFIPLGYRAAFSFEEQPAGMFRHLSVSVDTVGSLPSPQAVMEIAAAFGMEFPPVSGRVGRIWLEEFDPGHHAVNIIQLDSTLQLVTV